MAAAPEPTPQVETEYEPEDASASHRVDPVPPSEFRQSAPTVEPVPEPQGARKLPPSRRRTVARIRAHDVTSITPAGEMLSEPAEVLPVEEQESEPQGLKPHHEQRADGTAEAVPLSGTAAGFAPGHG